MGVTHSAETSKSSNVGRPVELDLLDQRTRSELASLAGSTPPTVTLLVASQHDVGLAVATVLARFWIPDQMSREHDLVVAIPDGRWNLEQLDTLVLQPLKMRSLTRRVVVIDRVEDFDPVTSDRMLKVIEDPSDVSTVFVLLTTEEELLAATLRGRAAARVRLIPADRIARVETLTRSGTAPQIAAAAVDAAGNLTMIAPRLAADQMLLDTAIALQDLPTIARTRPAFAAATAVELVDKLSKGCAPVFGEKASDRTERAAKRALTREYLEMVNRSVTDPVDRSTYDAELVAKVLAATDAAAGQLAHHAPTALVLTVAHLALRSS